MPVISPPMRKGGKKTSPYLPGESYQAEDALVQAMGIGKVQGSKQAQELLQALGRDKTQAISDFASSYATRGSSPSSGAYNQGVLNVSKDYNTKTALAELSFLENDLDRQLSQAQLASQERLASEQLALDRELGIEGLNLGREKLLSAERISNADRQLERLLGLQDIGLRRNLGQGQLDLQMEEFLFNVKDREAQRDYLRERDEKERTAGYENIFFNLLLNRALQSGEFDEDAIRELLAEFTGNKSYTKPDDGGGFKLPIYI